MKIEDLYYQETVATVDDSEFDIGKWRKEKPMDYLLAIYLLEQADGIAKDYMFWEIYKVTRLYIPDTLYKYYSFSEDRKLNRKKLRTLEKEQIYMSDISTFNDPFDGKGYFYNPKELAKYNRLDVYQGKLIEDFTKFIKATSLTTNGINSMPMWAHYGGNHTGYCISYDMKENVELSSCTFPVQYIEERLDITSFMKKQAKMILHEIDMQLKTGKKCIGITDLSMIYMEALLCNLKEVSWSYENEFRCTTGATGRRKQYLSAKPKAIYVGYKCQEEHQKLLVKIAKKLKVPIYKMKYEENKLDYELEYQSL